MFDHGEGTNQSLCLVCFIVCLIIFNIHYVHDFVNCPNVTFMLSLKLLMCNSQFFFFIIKFKLAVSLCMKSLIGSGWLDRCTVWQRQKTFPSFPDVGLTFVFFPDQLLHLTPFSPRVFVLQGDL